MFNSFYYNPAFAGTDGVTKITGLYRKWLGYTPTYGDGGAPTTQIISVHTPVPMPAGVGGYTVNDQLGPVSNFKPSFLMPTTATSGTGNWYWGSCRHILPEGQLWICTVPPILTTRCWRAKQARSRNYNPMLLWAHSSEKTNTIWSWFGPFDTANLRLWDVPEEPTPAAPVCHRRLQLRPEF